MQDNRLRTLYRDENWKLREFDEWIARQDPNWQPPPKLPHSRKKRARRLREMAQEAAAVRRAAEKEKAEEGTASLQVEQSPVEGPHTTEGKHACTSKTYAHS